MLFKQSIFALPTHSSGFHLITDIVENKCDFIGDFSVGMFQLFIQHTSASLTINENADPTVRKDFASHFDVMVPEDQPYYLHNYEGPDDMPAHIKTSLLGNSVLIPITKGSLNLGMWQGIYLCEHREGRYSRKVVATAWGE